MIIYQSRIMRVDLVANPTVFYVFGDNLLRTGYGGQAAEMRGMPNAIGIPTKRAPYAFLTDDDFDEAVEAIREPIGFLASQLSLDRIVIFPADGIGTGLAKLPTNAPRIWTYLNAKLQQIGIRNHG